MPKLKENDIVDYIIKNWDTLFKDEELYFFRKEFKVTDTWRVDLLAYVLIPNPDHPHLMHKAPVYIEVKFNHNDRDLIFELEKGLRYVHRSDRDPKYPRYLAVIADDSLDDISLEYIKKNNIPLYIYTLENDDLTTLKLSMYSY